ncbi:hypothetical protein DICPUDRAFT_41960 [Dictyostelium purpureum]|uniref:Deoxynucleoside kinase domain-containing protein n=1 Tax=Dictyostelium purpureum TaxID=5786 RepID=F1A160_DICPU|nr:uncharacterized protein DICPUDRAFT_41960 [Dictyostelium purpureum]EGC30074.1 hypothetical protein DICPUDRAFT_41960 [Dictyostelium purpureum]|eukprot:XP_003293404.1 hypothetical protein DICPUDRAFT_41960 [Dictyostelium purpureum]
MFRRSLIYMISNKMVVPTSTTASKISDFSNSFSKIIILEGNISAGKTFLASKLGDILGYKVFFEPTTTNPFLESFYKDPKKYALIMQLWLLNQRYNTYLNALQYSIENDRGVILDRSVYSDWVFAENCRLEGLINEDGFKEYSRKREHFLSNIPIPNTTLYLDVNPKECLSRIQNRKRDCELSIPLSYLEGLDSCYKSFLKEMKLKGSNVIVRDWNNFGDPLNIIKEINSTNVYSNSIDRKALLDLESIRQLINETESEKINLSEQNFFLNESKNRKNLV